MEYTAHEKCHSSSVIVQFKDIWRFWVDCKQLSWIWACQKQPVLYTIQVSRGIASLLAPALFCIPGHCYVNGVLPDACAESPHFLRMCDLYVFQ